MSTASRLLAPVVVGLTGALGLALVGTAIVVGGQPTVVAGAPLAVPIDTRPGSLPYRGSRGPSVLDAPGADPTAESAQPRPPAGRGQLPGTVALARGGLARLVRKEVGADAVLPVPELLDEATWWGAKIGAGVGATVLAGHVNWRGATGPFAELWDTAIGDQVSVMDSSGRAWRYTVIKVVTVGKDELPARAEELFGQDGPHRLVLVTCGGRWVGGDIGYAANRVVVADPVT
jgi:hypothetical protein